MMTSRHWSMVQAQKVATALRKQGKDVTVKPATGVAKREGYVAIVTWESEKVWRFVAKRAIM